MRARTVCGFLLGISAALLTGCISSNGGHHGSPTSNPASTTGAALARTATVSAAATASATAENSRYVPASQSDRVKIVAVPKRFAGENGQRLDEKGIPDHLVVGVPTHVGATVYRGNLHTEPAGVSVSATNADIQCGDPFLATQGHGYVVTCTVTARTKGTVTFSIIEHDPNTGARGTRSSVPIPAR